MWCLAMWYIAKGVKIRKQTEFVFGIMNQIKDHYVKESNLSIEGRAGRAAS